MDTIKNFILNEDKDIKELRKEASSLALLEKKFPTGVQIGEHWNALEWIDGLPYRLRVDALILDSLSRLFILKTRKRTKWLNPLKFYRVPGGSLERDKSVREVAEMEAMEEADIKIEQHNWLETGVSYIVPLNFKNDELLNSIYQKTSIPIHGGKTHIVIGRYTGENDNSKEEKADNALAKYGKFYPISSISHLLLKEHKIALNNYLGTNFPLEESAGGVYLVSMGSLKDRCSKIREEIVSLYDDEKDEKKKKIGKDNGNSDSDSFKDPKEMGLDSKNGLSVNFLVDENETRSSLYTAEIEKFFIDEYSYGISDFWNDVDQHLVGRYKGGSIAHFSVEQFREGMLYEREHTNSVPLRIKISLDHLTEHPEYYTYLRNHGILPLSEENDSLFRETALKLNKLCNINGTVHSSPEQREVAFKKFDAYIIKKFKLSNIISITDIPINNPRNSGVSSFVDPWGPAYDFLLTEAGAKNLCTGIKIEREHYPSFAKCIQIALDHLLVDFDYYVKLITAENAFENKEQQEDKPDKVATESSAIISKDDNLFDIFGFQNKLKITNFKKLYKEIIEPRMEKGVLYIYFTNSNTLLSKATVMVTKEPYNHVGIAFDKRLETMVSFDIGGGGLVYQHPLLSFNSRTIFELFKVRVTKKETEDILEFINSISKANKYNFSSILKSYILGMNSKIIDKKGSYRFTCATFTFFILDKANIQFNQRDKIVLSKVTPYDNLKMMNKKEIKFVASGNLFEYYYKCFNIRNNNSNVWKYSIRIIDSSLRKMTTSDTDKEKKLLAYAETLYILDNTVEVQPVFEETEMTEGTVPRNLEDMSSHISISAVILEDKKAVVVYHNKYSGWTFPMGKAQAGETLYTALCKEMKEELNINITHATPIETFKHTYVDGKNVTNVTHTIFLVDSYTGKIQNMEKDKHRELKFVAMEQLERLPNMLDPIKDFLTCRTIKSLNEEPLTSEKRKKIKVHNFGYIDEKGKGHYPLHDETHVRSAISMFHHCPDKYKKKVAKKIRVAAKKYNIKISNKEILNEESLTSQVIDHPTDIHGKSFNSDISFTTIYYLFARIDLSKIPHICAIVKKEELTPDGDFELPVFRIYPKENFSSSETLFRKVQDVFKGNTIMTENLDTALFEIVYSFEKEGSSVYLHYQINSAYFKELYTALYEGIPGYNADFCISRAQKLSFKSSSTLPISKEVYRKSFSVKECLLLDPLSCETTQF